MAGAAGLAPGVVFLSAPGRTERAALRLEYLAEDDYGLSAVWASIQRLDDPGVPAMELELALPGLALRRADGTSCHAPPPPPWAARPVQLPPPAPAAPRIWWSTRA